MIHSKKQYSCTIHRLFGLFESDVEDSELVRNEFSHGIDHLQREERFLLNLSIKFFLSSKIRKFDYWSMLF